MRFRPCIDIHNGKVKQIVGGSLSDSLNSPLENYISQKDGAFYARMYKKDGLKGGHIIILNPKGTPYYEESVTQAVKALEAYKGGLQIGGGMTPDNAGRFLDAGASHIIVTSYVFQNGLIQYDNLHRISRELGKDRLVLDLSCRKKEDGYYIVTDRWQKFTKVRISQDTLNELAAYCSEFLIHAVDVEGMCRGIEGELAGMLGNWSKIPVTYAGGVSSFADLELLRALGKGRLDVTVGSALDLFGGSIPYSRMTELK